jgi:hypothetical protein
VIQVFALCFGTKINLVALHRGFSVIGCLSFGIFDTVHYSIEGGPKYLYFFEDRILLRVEKDDDVGY